MVSRFDNEANEIIRNINMKNNKNSNKRIIKTNEIAKLIGKSDVYKCKIDIKGDINNFDFITIDHYEVGEVLAQVKNIERESDRITGHCVIIGYRDEDGVLNNIRKPFQPNAQIKLSDDQFIIDTIGLNRGGDALLGTLDFHPDILINVDLRRIVQNHISILAKSGSGKSYTVGVLLEEIMKKNIPIVILDPHGEYSSMKFPNTKKRDLMRLEHYNINPIGFSDNIKEWSPDQELYPLSEKFTLDLNSLTPKDLIDSFQTKLTPAQENILFTVLSSLNNRIDFDELIFNISNEESNSKWALITKLEELKKLKIYSNNPTNLNNIVQNGKCSILQLKGIDPYVQETIVSGLLKNLFEARKSNKIPPFLLVVEEAHNFCPENGIGKVKSSKIIRTIAGEGRKFGLGLCVISQRPAKVDKNVLSQCGTQVLLKMTNPNDLKSVTASCEGVESDSENEIKSLRIGTCLLTGLIDTPLKVNVRPRQSLHGGESAEVGEHANYIDDQTSDEEITNEKIEELIILTKKEKFVWDKIQILDKKFRTSELLLRTNYMYNEIQVICQSLEKKGLIKLIAPGVYEKLEK